MAGKIWRANLYTLTTGWIQQETSRKTARNQEMRFLRSMQRGLSQGSCAGCSAFCGWSDSARKVSSTVGWKAGSVFPPWRSVGGETQEEVCSARTYQQYPAELLSSCARSIESSVYQNVCSSLTGYIRRWQEGYN